MKGNWRKYLPYLHICFDVPFLSVSTSVVCRNDFGMIYEYVGLTIKVWKWRFDFRLYDTMKRMVERG